MFLKIVIAINHLYYSDVDTFCHTHRYNKTLDERLD